MAREALLSLDQAATLLMLSTERVRQLIKQGYIERRGVAQCTLVGAVQGYIRFLKDDERRSSKSAGASRVQDARAREIELKIAERDRRVIDVVEHDDFVAEIAGTLRSHLAGIPAKVTRDLVLRRRLEAELDGVLAKIADCIAEGPAVTPAEGSEAVPAVTVNGAGRLGRGEPSLPRNRRPTRSA